MDSIHHVNLLIFDEFDIVLSVNTWISFIVNVLESDNFPFASFELGSVKRQILAFIHRVHRAIIEKPVNWLEHAINSKMPGNRLFLPCAYTVTAIIVQVLIIFSDDRWIFLIVRAIVTKVAVHGPF